MSANSVYIRGVGLHPFGRFPEQSVTELGLHAVRAAIADAAVAVILQDLALPGTPWTPPSVRASTPGSLPGTKSSRVLAARDLRS